MTSNDHEIMAVLRAGKRCFEAHPYIAALCGARREAFTGSVGGYLTTLVNYPESHVNTQVGWLPTMLANRGMPRWLMEARHSPRSIVLSRYYRGELPELRRQSIGPDLVFSRLW
ncbi:MAG: hypothetical protein WCJ64_16875, partial [Rhodospirillaceae bacterium]